MRAEYISILDCGIEDVYVRHVAYGYQLVPGTAVPWHDIAQSMECTVPEAIERYLAGEFSVKH